MTWTNPPIVATGDFITAGLWNTYVRGNGLHLRGMLPDAGSSNQILLAASTTTAAWTSTLPDALLASAKVARAGDTMTGDLIMTRTATPTQGYVFLGNAGQWIGYTGSALQFTGNTIGHTGNGLLVPSNLIAAFPLAASIASGWTRYTNLDGRIPVGDGTTFSVTFTQGNFYGSSWSHSHATGWSSHSHGGGALGVTGTTGTENNQATITSGGGSAAASSHTHTAGSLDVSGSTDAAGGGATSTDQWLPALYAVVWAIKS